MASVSTSGRAGLAKTLKRIGEAAKARGAPQVQVQADLMVAEMKAKAPRRTGILESTIRSEASDAPGRVLVKAGGAATTKALKRGAKYAREVRIGSGDTQGIAKQAGGADVSYDYAFGAEFGNEHMAAEPFFFTTYRRRRRSAYQAILDGAREGAASVPGVSK